MEDWSAGALPGRRRGRVAGPDELEVMSQEDKGYKHFCGRRRRHCGFFARRGFRIEIPRRHCGRNVRQRSQGLRRLAGQLVGAAHAQPPGQQVR